MIGADEAGQCRAVLACKADQSSGATRTVLRLHSAMYALTEQLAMVLETDEMLFLRLISDPSVTPFVAAPKDWGWPHIAEGMEEVEK